MMMLCTSHDDPSDFADFPDFSDASSDTSKQDAAHRSSFKVFHRPPFKSFPQDMLAHFLHFPWRLYPLKKQPKKAFFGQTTRTTLKENPARSLSEDTFPEGDALAPPTYYRLVASCLSGLEHQKKLAQALGVSGATWEEACQLLQVSSELGGIVPKLQTYQRYAPRLFERLCSEVIYPQERLETVGVLYQAWGKGVRRGRC